MRLYSAGSGFLNGLFGAGGGMLAVPILTSAGLSPQKAHATSLAVILPLTLVTATVYMINGHVSLPDVLPYLPMGLLGAAAGAMLLPRLPEKVLRTVFSAFLMWAAVRMLLM